MLGVRFRTEDPVFHGVKAHVEKRSRIGARAQIAAQTEAALGKQIAPDGEISRTPECQIISLGNPEAFLARGTEGRRQESRSAIEVMQRKRGVRQIDYRYVFNAKRRRGNA